MPIGPDLAVTVLANGFIVAFLWRVADKVDALAKDVHHMRGRLDSREESK